MTPISKERLAFNIVNSPKRASVVTNWAIGAVAAILALVTPEQRDAMLAALPIQPVWLPLIAAAVVFTTQMWPQFNIPKPPEPSDEAVAKTVGEAVPASNVAKTVNLPAATAPTVDPNETIAERRAREDKELAERRAAEDAEIAAREAAGPMTEFSLDDNEEDEIAIAALRKLAPNLSERSIMKLKLQIEQIREEKLAATQRAPLAKMRTVPPQNPT